MISLNKIAGTNIFEFIIDGVIDEVSIDEISYFFKFKSERNETVKLLATIDNFPSLGDYKSFVAMLKMKKTAIGTIDKYAVLSDNDGIETLLPIGNLVTPGIPIKHFHLNKRDEAISWLKIDKPNSVSGQEYVSKMIIL